MHPALRIARWAATVLLTVALTIYLVRAFDSRSRPDLGPEHRITFAHEFDAGMEETTDWAAYLAIEERLAEELAAKIPAAERPPSLVDRYATDSLTSPSHYDGNWNRSYTMRSSSPRGVAVLLHGLTDSPYSMLATAQALVGAGYNVVAPRMPGHGFAVGGLLQVRWEDWSAAVRIAVGAALELPGAEQSLLLVGYSNGGLMAVDYALECGNYDGLPCPDGLVLMSPAIDVSRLAMATNLHAIVSWLPWFEKFKWETVLPEVDPFKFTSFPKRAAWEIYRILRRTHGALADPARAAQLPPVLTFQSAVDNTVSAQAIDTLLYARLPANGSKLVVYGVNNNNTMLQLMKGEPVDPAQLFLSQAPLNFDVEVIQNRDANSLAVDVVSLAAGATESTVTPTRYRWPRDIYSLSHIAVPFRPDDLVYGDGERSESAGYVVFGAAAPRGERRVLQLNPDYFLRMRYNPFFGLQQRYLVAWLASLPAAETAPPAAP